MLIITIIQIKNTYAMYKDQVLGMYNQEIGKWNIKLNETLITTGSQIVNFNIDDVKYVENPNVTTRDQNGNEVGPHVIAPESEAYFTICIDPTDTDVAIKYIVKLESISKFLIKDLNKEYNFNDGNFSIKKVVVEKEYNNGEEKKTSNYNPSETFFSHVIPLADIKKGVKEYVTVYFKWYNIEAYSESTTRLSDFAKNHDVSLIIPVNVKAEQYVRVGKNIFDINNWYSTGKGITPTIKVSNNRMEGKADWKTGLCYYFENLNPNSKYMLSFKTDQSTPVYYYIKDRDADASTFRSVRTKKALINPRENGTATICFITGDNNLFYDYNFYDIQLEEGTTATEYEPFEKSYSGTNLFDKYTTLDGYELLDNTISKNEEWYVSDYILVKNGKSYVKNGKQGDRVQVYDENKNLIETTLFSSNVITINNKNSKYIRINGLLSDKHEYTLKEQ